MKQPKYPLDAVHCPGCAARLAVRNKGCKACGYTDNETGRIQSFREIITAPMATPKKWSLSYNDVSPLYMWHLSQAAIAESHMPKDGRE